MNEFEKLLDEMMLARDRSRHYGTLENANAEHETYLALKDRLIEFSKAVDRVWTHIDRIDVYGVEFFSDKYLIMELIAEDK
jgi:hypothetical protein